MMTEGELHGIHSVRGLYTEENDKAMLQSRQCTKGGHDRALLRPDRCVRAGGGQEARKRCRTSVRQMVGKAERRTWQERGSVTCSTDRPLDRPWTVIPDIEISWK